MTPQYDATLYHFRDGAWGAVAQGRLDDGRLRLELDSGWEHPAFREVLPRLEAAFAARYPPAPPTGAAFLGDPDALGDLDPRKFEVVRAELLDEYRQPHAKPWILGFSGGKDSTLLLQLVVDMLLTLPVSRRARKVYVVSNDTQVESPIVQAFIDKTLAKIREAAPILHLPMEVVQTKPDPDQTFWVNLIGRGYRAPSQHFRWCTDRMKIRPTAAFIERTTDAAGGSILLLGVRHDESKTRSRSIQRHGTARLNPHKVTPGCAVFRPIQHLTTAEVWAYLLQNRPAWGGTHRELVTLYRNAMAGECPFVTDLSDAPSCGNNPSSRFGCWTCTVVEKDKSLEGFIAAGFEHLEPLVEFRDWIKALSEDYSRREAQRRDASEGIGPFTLATRQEILTRLLAIQAQIGIPLIAEDELRRIYDLWSEDTQFKLTGQINRYRQAEGLPLVTMRRGKQGREVTGLPPTPKRPPR